MAQLSMPDGGEVLHEGRCRILLRLELVEHACVRQPHETTEHPVRAFSMKLRLPAMFACAGAMYSPTGAGAA